MPFFFEHQLPFLLGGTIHQQNSQYFSTVILGVWCSALLAPGGQTLSGL